MTTSKSEIIVRRYEDADLAQMILIWNQVVEDGIAFPQTEPLNKQTGRAFFQNQTFTGIAEQDGAIIGLYILHPNNIGRCGHIGNCSYAVKSGLRGLGVGEKLVSHSLETAAGHGFRLIQFNAVVSTNHGALHLYEKLGFTRLGTIPGGFLMKDGHYEDIVLFYIEL